MGDARFSQMFDNTGEGGEWTDKDRQTGSKYRQADRQTDRQADRQACRQTDTQTDTQTETETERETKSTICDPCT